MFPGFVACKGHLRSGFRLIKRGVPRGSLLRGVWGFRVVGVSRWFFRV